MIAARHIAALLIFVPIIGACVAAFAHEPYTDWLAPNGARCCSDVNRECRPVRSYRGDDERYYILLHGSWRPVPLGALLQRPSPDGSSHACVGADDTIYCFVNGAQMF